MKTVRVYPVRTSVRTSTRLVGEILVSNGEPWTKGKFTADAFYVAFRKRQKRIRWPGRFLVSVAESGGGYGVDDWLLDQGLERAS